MTNYKGLLAKRIKPLGLLDCAENHKSMIEARDDALFAHFQVDRKQPTAWRDLALALAAKHVTAYQPPKGKPRKNFDEDRVWIQLFALIKIRDNSTDAGTFKNLAEVVQKDIKLVTWRIKEFKKEHSKIFDLAMKIYLWIWAVNLFKSRDILDNVNAERMAADIAGSDPKQTYDRLQKFRVFQAKTWAAMRHSKSVQTNNQPFLWSNEEIQLYFKEIIQNAE